jgi:glycosyltransferase involved in cell wall biosynthesis
MPESVTPPGISCLLPFYSRDDPAHFEMAVDSVLRQTRPPDEIVFVEDGPSRPELHGVVAACSQRVPVQHLRLEQNQGLGRALAHGVLACRYTHVARMDADDWSRPQRLATQWALMSADPELLLLGSAAEEFMHHPGDLRRARPIQESDQAVRRQAPWRNPFNHMTVMFRRDAVLRAGNYRHCLAFEDYDLWLRVLCLPGRVANLQQTLVDARAGDAMLARRRGWAYVQREWAFLRNCRREGLLSNFAFTRAVLMRLPLRLLPSEWIAVGYRHLLRRSARH